MEFGKYNFINQDKLRRAQVKAGKGAKVEDVAREYLKMAGLLKDLDGERINELEKTKTDKAKEAKAKKEADAKEKKEKKLAEKKVKEDKKKVKNKK